MYYFNINFCREPVREFNYTKPRITDELERNKILEFSQLVRDIKGEAYYTKLRKMNKIFRKKLHTEKHYFQRS